MGNASVRKTSILLIDDSVTNLQLLSEILTRRGYIVRSATSGHLGLLSAQHAPPDLILLDIMMPEMDGYQVCERLKADARTRDATVIFISALDGTLNKVKAFDVGGVDYVTRPFQVREILARVETHLDLRRLQIRLEEANVKLEEQNVKLEARNAELQRALETIKTLSGLVPICAWCGRKIQDELGQWVMLETYIEEHSDAEFTHGICPGCLTEWEKQLHAPGGMPSSDRVD